MQVKLIVLLAVVVMGAAGLAAFCGGDRAPAAPVVDPVGVNPIPAGDGKGTERVFAYKTVADITDICLAELCNQGLFEDEEGFAPVLRSAKPAAPVFVKSLDDQYPDYYMINFVSNRKVVAVAIMGVKDGKTELKECHRFDPQANLPPVSADEAKSVARRAGKAIGPAQAKLVFKFSAQCPGAVLPAWDLGDNVRVAQNGDVFGDFAPEPKSARP